MKKLLFFFFLYLSYYTYSQVGIGNTNPKGILDINNPTNTIYGLVLPTNEATANMLNPQGGNIAIGTIMYDSTDDCIKYYHKNSANDNIERWSPCILQSANNDIAELNYIVLGNSFTANYMEGVPMTSRNTFKIAVTNKSYVATNINFLLSDLELNGIEGITVTSVSPTTASLGPGATVEVTYSLSGTPQDCGTLQGIWKKTDLEYSKSITVSPGVIFNCSQGTWDSPVTPEYRLTGLVPGQSYSGTYTVPYTRIGDNNNCDLAPEILTHRGLTLSFPGGPVSPSGTITYTLSGTYNGPANSGWALFTNVGGCEIYIGPCSSCKEILEIFPGTPSGVYKVNPDKQGAALATQDAQCDMTTDGGGWTLMANYAVSYAAQPIAYSSTTGLPTNSFNNKLPVIGTEILGVNEVGNPNTFGSGMAILSGFIEQPTEWRVSGMRSTNNSTVAAATVNWKAPITVAIRNSMIAGEAFTNSTLPTSLPGNTVTPTIWGNACCSAWGGRNFVNGVTGNDNYGFWIGYLQVHRTNASNNPNATRDNAIYRLWVR